MDIDGGLGRVTCMFVAKGKKGDWQSFPYSNARP